LKRSQYSHCRLSGGEHKTLLYIGYLWVLPDNNGMLGVSLQLVRTSDGLPFELPHKAEGLALLDDGRLFIVHDD
jgi:hypothetical protein